MTDRPALITTMRAEIAAIQPSLAGDWPADALFQADLALDSLDLVELVARMEQRLALQVPDADLHLLVSLDALADYLLARRAEALRAAA